MVFVNKNITINFPTKDIREISIIDGKGTILFESEIDRLKLELHMLGNMIYDLMSASTRVHMQSLESMMLYSEEGQQNY